MTDQTGHGQAENPAKGMVGSGQQAGAAVDKDARRTDLLQGREKKDPQAEMAVCSDREAEEAHLADCLTVIKANIAAYEEDVRQMNAEIKQMYDQYRDDDPEIFTELSNTITMNENMKTALAKNLRALKKP